MHDLFKAWHLLLLSIAAVFLASMTLGCGGGARDETVAGAVVPVPRSMERLSGEGIELSLPGFGGGQASFQGNMAPEKIIEFYKKEMPARLGTGHELAEPRRHAHLLEGREKRASRRRRAGWQIDIERDHQQYKQVTRARPGGAHCVCSLTFKVQS